MIQLICMNMIYDSEALHGPALLVMQSIHFQELSQCGELHWNIKILGLPVGSKTCQHKLKDQSADGSQTVEVSEFKALGITNRTWRKKAAEKASQIYPMPAKARKENVEVSDIPILLKLPKD